MNFMKHLDRNGINPGLNTTLLLLVCTLDLVHEFGFLSTFTLQSSRVLWTLKITIFKLCTATRLSRFGQPLTSLPLPSPTLPLAFTFVGELAVFFFKKKFKVLKKQSFSIRFPLASCFIQISFHFFGKFCTTNMNIFFA
jgi:hypothetical protein